RHPLTNMAGVVGAIYLPRDGQADPGNVALAMARGARNAGVTICENVKVVGIRVEKAHVRGVMTAQGPIAADGVINCAGMSGRRVEGAGGGGGGDGGEEGRGFDCCCRRASTFTSSASPAMKFPPACRSCA